MKIWIEVTKYETVYMHTVEPNPDPNSGHWKSKGWHDIALSGGPRDFFINRIKKDTVAEFELNCIWERVKND